MLAIEYGYDALGQRSTVTDATDSTLVWKGKDMKERQVALSKQARKALSVECSLQVYTRIYVIIDELLRYLLFRQFSRFLLLCKNSTAILDI